MTKPTKAVSSEVLGIDCIDVQDLEQIWHFTHSDMSQVIKLDYNTFVNVYCKNYIEKHELNISGDINTVIVALNAQIL